MTVLDRLRGLRNMFFFTLWMHGPRSRFWPIIRTLFTKPVDLKAERLEELEAEIEDLDTLLDKYGVPDGPLLERVERLLVQAGRADTEA